MSRGTAAANTAKMIETLIDWVSVMVSTATSSAPRTCSATSCAGVTPVRPAWMRCSRVRCDLTRVRGGLGRAVAPCQISSSPRPASRPTNAPTVAVPSHLDGCDRVDDTYRCGELRNLTLRDVDNSTATRGWICPGQDHQRVPHDNGTWSGQPVGTRNDHGRGGPASIRFRCRATGSLSIDQSDSTHQVAPASTHSLTCASPADPGRLTPSATTSYPTHDNPAASRSGRTAVSTSTRSVGVKGVS